MATTMRFAIDVDDRGGSAAFARVAASADSASRAVEHNSRALQLQSKTAEVSARATLSMARSGKILDDALRELDIAEGRVTRQQAELAAMTEEAQRQLDKEGRAAEVAAIKLQLAGKEAKGAGDGALFAGKGFGALGPGLTSVIGGAVALAPIAVTLGAGLGGLGLAALQTAKRTDEMRVIFGPLKAEVRDFQNSLQPQVLQVFGDGASIATDALKQLQPVAAATGNALHGVLGQVGAEFRSGTWKQFFQFMADQAGPDLQLVGKLLVDLLHDIPPLLEQLQPLGRVILILADGVLKAVGGLEKLHLVLPIVGAAAGLLLGGGPIGALIGAFAGLAIQEFSAARATKEVAAQFQAVAKVTFPSSSAVSVDWAAVAGSLGKVAVSATDVANAMIDLHPKVGTIRGDMDLLNASIVSGNTQLAAYADLWNTFVGKSVSYQQAVLNLRQAFEGYDSAVKSSGRTSTAAQQSFLSIFTTMESGLQTLRQQHASIGQVNDFYKTTIDRLNALHGLTPVQRADIQGVTKDYLAWASSVQGLDPRIRTAASDIRDNMLVQLGLFHRLAPATKADTDAFANAILKTGSDSRATAADRQRLINDLIHSGLSATDAKAQVIKFQAQINALKGKTVSVAVTASGSGGLKITGPGASGKVWDLTHNAAGGMITGGVPGKDSVLGLLMPGEVVVPTAMVKAGAVDHLRGRLPGFDAGGLVQAAPWAANNLAGLAGPELGGEVAAVLRALIKAAQAASGLFGGPGSGALGGDPAANRALAMRMFPWPMSMWASFDYLEMREAGYNRFARNPSSGAYGIPQALPPTKMPFAAQAAGGSHAGPQLSWMFGYISQRYGNPFNAALHERFNNWYGNGLDAVISRPTLIGVGERGPERVTVTPRGRGGGGGNTYNINVSVAPGGHPAETGKAIVKLIIEHEKVSGDGWRR